MIKIILSFFVVKCPERFFVKKKKWVGFTLGGGMMTPREIIMIKIVLGFC